MISKTSISIPNSGFIGLKTEGTPHIRYTVSTIICNKKVGISFDKSAFTWITDYHELNYQNERFILFHYPIEEWNHFFRGSIHLHGHQHNHADYNHQNLERGLRRFYVGVDANDMSPVSIDDIMSFFR